MANVLYVAGFFVAISVGVSNSQITRQPEENNKCPVDFNLGDPCLTNCFNGLNCGGNTTCTTERFVCQCASTHYDDTGTDDTGGSCDQRIPSGMSCPDPSTGVLSTDSCSDPYATCMRSSSIQYICQCNDGYYNNGGKCTLLSEKYLGEVCRDFRECIDSNAICPGTCQCKSTHYDDTGIDDIGGTCVQKVGVDKQCPYTSTEGVVLKYVCSDPNASCRLSSGQNTCQCNGGYYNSGGTCTRDLCECEKDGKCIDGRCYFPQGYFGQRCESLFCSAKACYNGGLCIENSSQHRCVCESGYFGTECQNKLLELGRHCKNSNYCHDRNAVCHAASNTCQCAEGFHNVDGICEVLNTDICECPSYAKCVDGRCFCPDGYFGKHCESHFCSAAECSNGGLCIENSSQKRCVCETGNFGSICQNSSQDIKENCLRDGSADQSRDTQNQFTASDLASAAGSVFAAAVVLCLLVFLVCRLHTHKKLCFRNKEPTSTDKMENASKPVTMKVHKQHQRHEVLYENSGCDTTESEITSPTYVNDGLTVPTSIYETMHPENCSTDHVYSGIVTSDKSGSCGNTDHRKPASVKSDDKIAKTDHVYLNLNQGSNLS